MSDMPKILLVNRCFVKDVYGKFLIIKRSGSDAHSPGKWECPGGKVDCGQSIYDALEREVLEETGLTLKITDQLVFFLSENINEGKYAGFLYLVLFHIAHLAGGELRLSEEHEGSAWVSYEELFLYDLTEETKKAAMALKSYLE